MAYIKCGHCSTKDTVVHHHSVAQVRACGRRAASQSASPISSAVRTQQTPAAPAWELKTPRAMIEAMRDGYYAVSPEGGNDFDSHVFIRVSRPKRGRNNGCLVIQTQHSDNLHPFLVIYPSGRALLYQRKDRVDMSLLMIAADPYTPAIQYSKLHKVCCRCHKKLTDERSRWYGIGPECEGYWPEIINTINNSDRGPFGSGQ